MSRKWFGEPALILQGAGALVALLLAWKAPGINDHTAAAITAVITATAATVTAVAVRPWAPSIFGGLIGAVITLFASYGVHLSQSRTAAVTAVVASFVAILTRPQQTPVEVQPR